MVLPLYDDNSDRELFPWVNYALIAVNVLVFVGLQRLGTNEEFTYAWSIVPQRIQTGQNKEMPQREIRDPVTDEIYRFPEIPKTPGSPYLTLLTAMFLHGGIAHILGNMWFLWIFGDNVEDRLGHIGYLIFYLICGILAGLAHIGVTYLTNADEDMPCLGASGAISGVLGGYLLLFPQRRVVAIVFRIITEVPAFICIGIWFVFQIVSSLGFLGSGTRTGGVAYGAHIGGFLAGLLLVNLFARFREAER